MNPTLMRYSAKRALAEGKINKVAYSKILAQADRIESKKISFDEKIISEARKDLTRSAFITH